MTLSEIGDKHGTAKNTHVTNGKVLLDLYEPIFEKKRLDKINILEIGVLNGASLRTWKEYFPYARIIGLDIDTNSVYNTEERIQIQIGDQRNKNDLDKVINRAEGNFDIIIDDGSHVNKYTLFSFHYLFPFLNSGGIYIIEDTICTYDKVDMNWPGMKLNRKNMNTHNDRGMINDFLLRSITSIDTGDIYPERHTDIFSIQIYRNVLIFVKK